MRGYSQTTAEVAMRFSMANIPQMAPPLLQIDKALSSFAGRLRELHAGSQIGMLRKAAWPISAPAEVSAFCRVGLDAVLAPLRG